jgi:hypothetical protein
VRLESDGKRLLKDPRATLLLDFWDSVLPQARYVLLYRSPWDVADSMQRLGAHVFLDNPEYAYRIWRLYNRRMLDFHERCGERSVLVRLQALLEAPARFDLLLAERLDVDLSAATFADLLAEDGLRTLSPNDPLVRLFECTSADTAALLDQLDERADLPAPVSRGATTARGRRRFTSSRPPGRALGGTAVL